MTKIGRGKRFASIEGSMDTSMRGIEDNRIHIFLALK